MQFWTLERDLNFCVRDTLPMGARREVAQDAPLTNRSVATLQSGKHLVWLLKCWLLKCFQPKLPVSQHYA